MRSKPERTVVVAMSNGLAPGVGLGQVHAGRLGVLVEVHQQAALLPLRERVEPPGLAQVRGGRELAERNAFFGAGPVEGLPPPCDLTLGLLRLTLSPGLRSLQLGQHVGVVPAQNYVGQLHAGDLQGVDRAEDPTKDLVRLAEGHGEALD
eukprot:5286786-Alexandrium_andersonii.AAC.1